MNLAGMQMNDLYDKGENKDNKRAHSRDTQETRKKENDNQGWKVSMLASAAVG